MIQGQTDAAQARCIGKVARVVCKLGGRVCQRHEILGAPPCSCASRRRETRLRKPPQVIMLCKFRMLIVQPLSSENVEPRSVSYRPSHFVMAVGISMRPSPH